MQASLDQLVILLSSSIAQRRLYFADHPKVQSLGKDFVTLLRNYLDDIGQDEVFIGVIEGKLVHNGRYLIGPSIAGRQLIEFIGLLRCGGIAFNRQTSDLDVRKLLSLAVEIKEPLSDLTESRQLLASREISNVRVAAAYRDKQGFVAEESLGAWQGKDQGYGKLDSPLLVYQALYDTVSGAHGNAALNRTLDMDSTRSVSEYLLHSTRDSFTDIMQVMQYPDFDSYTVGHSVRVATLAVHIGNQAGLSDEQLLDMGTAGLLHDVGKSRIPDEILYKPGHLDTGEFQIMQSHAILGAEILLEHKNVTLLDVAAAWGHHIRHDGGGYPTSPPWGVRSKITALLQICDVFEALTAIRPYKAPMKPRTAYEIMLRDEGAFDPVILRAFIRSLGLYPPGNTVRLSDGTFACVVAAGSDIARPRVRLTHDAAGSPLAEAMQAEVDLGAKEQNGLAVMDLLLDPADVLTRV
jgi:putative nucleotidyltransferase with HDIG domain